MTNMFEKNYDDREVKQNTANAAVANGWIVERFEEVG